MNFAPSRLVSAILLTCCIVSNAADPIDIGSHRELFVGDQLVDRMDNLSFRLHEPRKGQRPQSPLPIVRLKSDVIWKERHEHSTYVFQDKIWVTGGHAKPLNNEVWTLDFPSGWLD